MHISHVSTQDRDSEGRLVLGINGHQYVVGSVVRAQPAPPGTTEGATEGYVRYWAQRNGQKVGPIRRARAADKPGTTGRAIWAAATAPSV